MAKPLYFAIVKLEVRHCRWVGAATKLKAGGMGCTLGSFGAGGTGGMVGRVDQPVGRFGLARLLPSNRQAGEVSVVLWHDARLVTSKAGSGR